MRFAPVLVLIAALPCSAQMVSGGSSGVRYLGQPNQPINDPVSMVFERRQSQTLTDGTHIDSDTHEYFYRDSQGRTRTENQGDSQSSSSTQMSFVTVVDPVAGTFTSWLTGLPDGTLHEFNRSEMRKANQPLAPAPAVHATQSIQAIPQQASRPRPKTTTENLGVQNLQGLQCDAMRITVVYPVDFMGNDRPITTVTQRCQSREFNRTLSDSIEDPRTGVRATMLQSVSRAEPDPSLFVPPADYVDANPTRR